MDFMQIFRAKAVQLHWAPLPADHVVVTTDRQLIGVGGSQVIEPDTAYFTVRLKEMYVETGRKLWRRFHPMLHAFTQSTVRQEHTIAGPSQLRDFGEVNLDRIIHLNYRLAGPTVFRGGDVRLLLGLYAVPGEDAARALIDTVGEIARLGGFQAGMSVEIAGAVKTGVEKILGLDGATLQLGVDCTFASAQPFTTGWYVGIAAPSSRVRSDLLWLKDGRLFQGEDPITAKPFQEADYLVVEVERTETYPDWPSITGMTAAQQKLLSILGGDGSIDDKRAALRRAWPEFQALLNGCQYLSRPDKERIAGDVVAEVKRLLNKLDPFGNETRGIEATSVPTLDFLEVPGTVDLSDPKSVALARVALTGQPFDPTPGPASG